MPSRRTGAGAWSTARSKYQLIALDAYRPPYIPWHLTTREFFQVVHDHLTEDGVMAINVGRAPGDRRLIDGLVGTIRTVFPSVHVMDIPDTFNSIIYASVQPTQPQDLYDNLVYLYTQRKVHPLLVQAIATTLENIQPTTDSQTVYTDDRAPIEWETNNMVLKFLFSKDMERLQ